LIVVVVVAVGTGNKALCHATGTPNLKYALTASHKTQQGQQEKKREGKKRVMTPCLGIC